MDELGVLRSFTRRGVLNDITYSDSWLRAMKYRPEYPGMQYASKKRACWWVDAFVDLYNHRDHHSGIRFASCVERQSESYITIFKQSADVYEKPSEYIQHEKADLLINGINQRRGRTVRQS